MREGRNVQGVVWPGVLVHHMWCLRAGARGTIDRMGENRTPKRVLEKRGSWRAKIRGDEPAMPPGACRNPADLPVKPGVIAADIMRYLSGMGLLAACDEGIVARYAWIESRARKTARWLEKYPDHENFSDREARLIKLSAEARQLEKVLGLGAAHRANLSGQPSNELDGIAALMQSA